MFLFLSCFHVHVFTVPKAILTRVCKIISLKNQRFLRNLFQRKKHLYLHLRNWSFLQQKVHKLTISCYSVSLFSLFIIYVSFVSLLHFCSACQIPSTKQTLNLFELLKKSVHGCKVSFVKISVSSFENIFCRSVLIMSLCTCFLFSFSYYWWMTFLK